ncbi:hypothetical protein EW146_g9674 [Bondarzewia mesenterica]|uniref:Uncharacterized protein n=2 Tax=Bondarzewia mesenterica TaxID=1095465 RepID=A0A4S4L4I1_9AGAM|nr:hypothetical protein EW146_g9674 [Bondarzewia mesenterica]
MDNVHDAAWQGTLTAERLKSYLANADPSILDSPGGLKSMTPLAAASSRGYLDIVRLLLQNHANPNALSLYNRTPLFYATSRSPAHDRLAIVRALLDAGALIDACSADDAFYTPLMNAVTEVRDKDVAHELVDRGASLTLKNAQGQTAEMLAKETGMVRDLRPREERNSTRAQIIDLILSVVMLIIAYINSGVMKGSVKGIVKKLYGISGDKDQEVAKDIPEPHTVEEFKDSLNTYVADSGLEKFFGRDDPFLQTLAENAAALRDDNTTFLGKPENIRHLTRLALYQPVIYCDDSGSMDAENRYTHLRELVTRIARIATKIVPENLGVELRFINSRSSSNLSAVDIDAAVAAVHPNGGTAIGTNLRQKILEPLVYGVLSDPNKSLRRPLLVCTITDGCPSEEQPMVFRDAIVECRRQLVNHGYEPSAAMFSISQIGDDAKGTAFLDGLRGDQEVEDVLHCTTDRLDSKYQELRMNERRIEEWLLKLLTKPIMERDES